MAATRTRRTRRPQTDPRVVGGTYRSGYSGREYTVLATFTAPGAFVPSWTVQWADDNSIVTHGTGWDHRRDVIVSAPAA